MSATRSIQGRFRGVDKYNRVRIELDTDSMTKIQEIHDMVALAENGKPIQSAFQTIWSDGEPIQVCKVNLYGMDVALAKNWVDKEGQQVYMPVVCERYWHPPSTRGYYLKLKGIPIFKA